MANPNFNYGLAYRSQGVTPDMYSDDPEEAQKMMNEDMDARWKQGGAAAFRQGMVGQAAKERNAKPQGGAYGQPRATGHAVANGNAMGNAPLPQWRQPQAAQHFAAQADMIGQTNEAIAKEMESRRKKAEAESERQHEREMEAIKQQGASERSQYSPQGGGGYQQNDEARQARNRSLLGMAGLGGHRITSGPEGTSFTPHPYTSPLARSLLG